MNDLNNLIAMLNSTADILAVVLLALALILVLTTNIQRMIRLYQGQSILLVVIALVTFITPGPPEVILAMIPPFILAASIEYLLARATVPVHEQRSRRDMLLQARSLWLRQGPARTVPLVRAIDFAVVMITYAIAFAPATTKALNTPAIEDQFGLAIALGLLILGLFALSTQGHLIAQVMGLLVAEHGLFYAVVRLVHTTLPVFIFSLLLYILLTLMILLVLLPDLRRVSASTQVTDQRELRG